MNSSARLDVFYSCDSSPACLDVSHDPSRVSKILLLNLTVRQSITSCCQKSSHLHLCWRGWTNLPESKRALFLAYHCSQYPGPLPVVDKVHRSSTWVKVQIRIIKYYSSKSKSTAFSILLEWKYKSTQFFMYLSKKVLIDRFILQFYIDYFI